MSIITLVTYNTNSSSRISASYNATRQSQTGNFFLWWWLKTLHQLDVRMVHSLWRWYLSILFDAQHTHLIAVLRTENGMRKAIGEAHRRYARMINFREGKERVSVAGTVSLIGDGWTVFIGSGQIYRVKSSKGTISYWSDSIYLEQCESPYWKTKRCACKGVTAVRVDCWLGACPRMPFSLNSLSCSKNYPRNINYIPAVIFFAFLDLRKYYYSRTGS